MGYNSMMDGNNNISSDNNIISDNDIGNDNDISSDNNISSQDYESLFSGKLDRNKCLEEILKIAEQEFSLTIPSDRINILYESRTKFLEKALQSLRKEVGVQNAHSNKTERLYRKLKPELDYDQNEIYTKIKSEYNYYKNDVGSFYRPKLNRKRKLEHQLYILYHHWNNVLHSRYDVIKSIAHETGHAVYYEYTKNLKMLYKKNLFNTNMHWALLEEKLMKRYKLLKTDEKRSYNNFYLNEHSNLLCAKKDIKTTSNAYREAVSHYKKSRRAGLSALQAYSMNKEIMRIKEVLSLSKQIFRELKKSISSISNLARYYRKNKTTSDEENNPVNNEGWACYFTFKIMREIIKKEMQHAYPEKHLSEIEQTITFHEKNTEMIPDYPILGYYIKNLRFYLNRKDEYGEGLRKYLAIKDVEEAKRMAGIVD